MTHDLRALLIEPQERRFRERFDLADAPLELIVSGYTKLVIVGADRVFTFPRHAGHVADLEREADVLAHLKLEVAPTLLGRHLDREISPYPFLELTRRPGRSWDTVDRTVDDDAAASMYESLARQVARIQQRDTPPHLAERPAALDPLRVLPRWTDPTQITETLRVMAVDPPTCLRALEPVLAMEAVAAHGELSDGQILIGTDMTVTGIVDWGGFHRNHPFRDLDFGIDGHRTSYRPDRWPEIQRRIWTAYAHERGGTLPPWPCVRLFWLLLDLDWLAARAPSDRFTATNDAVDLALRLALAEID